MKTTTKIKTLLVLAISAFFSNTSSAQDTAASNYDQGFRLGVGANVGYATQDPYKLALGGDVRLQYDLSKRYSLTLTTGYTNLFVSKADGNDVGFIPAKAGFKAFIWDDQFYVMGEAGAAFAVSNGNNETSLLLSPSIGYATKYIDVSLHYEHYSDFDKINNNGTYGKGFGQVGVRLAYGFKL
ncbi:hypothetical protein HNQ02_002470 [Flavobacterium sp. 7E]|uniref:hypothetical protein n=1 Tax=unclassified Flavobacterium TaxID=196869 RepID=UPI00156FF663|nr:MULTISPECIES: hypothetical protein [unclassified Flavobacterium]MBE0390919.1 hypothetical protein [Flavobacterium sp. PL002]NRS89539.1 hypothetical protein [Flavobacterium sp. 7E]NRT16926.1 hypothetical protein [Flavobacterium sp. 28A]